MIDRSRTSDILSIYVPSFFIFVGMGIVSPVLAIYATSFGVSFALVSLAVSIYAVGRLVMDFPAGILADHFGRKPLMVAGCAILSVFAYLSATADNFWLFLVYRFFQGFGSSMWMTSRTTLLADILKPEERGRVLGYFQSFTLIGQAAGPTIGGIIAESWGLRANFYFYTVAGLISMFLSYFFIKEPGEAKSRHGGLSLPKGIVKRLLVNRGFMFAAAASFMSFFLMSGVRQTTLPLYADIVVGLDPAGIGMMLSCITIMNMILTIPVGYGIDLLGRKPIIVGSMIMSALACILFPQANSFLLLCAVALVMGVGSSGANQAPLAMATDTTISEPHGISMGIFRFFGDMGSLIGPVLLGVIADSSGLVVTFYVMAAIILVNAGAIFLFGEETLPSKRKKSGESGVPLGAPPPGAG